MPSSDRLLILVVACALLPACPPRVRPEGPGAEPSPVEVGAPARRPPPSREPHDVIFGEMCPGRAGGAPAVGALLLREGLVWSADPRVIEARLARGAVPRFTVLDHAGRRAGIFTVAGLGDLGAGPPAAVGGYAGAAVCADPATALECQRLAAGCGLALGAPGGEDALVEGAGACLVGGAFVFDSDGDGAAEAYAAADFLDELHDPVAEVAGQPTALGGCEPRFSRRGVLPGGGPKGFEGLDQIGVVDLEGDGRLELLLQLRYLGKRTFTVYAPAETAPSLILLAEVEPWSAAP